MQMLLLEDREVMPKEIPGALASGDAGPAT